VQQAPSWVQEMLDLAEEESRRVTSFYESRVIETLLNLAHSSGLGDLDGGFDVSWEQFWIKGCGFIAYS